ncbi:MAG: bifunctional phosphoribosyl-AMP cyclohydrolase/phosphoribosyl-ATP diphosphatase HisIE [Bacteroidia bacterium]|nr:bifunctional phosphoribosyl-AMP cyclohydrolase/phosphoribosyl-ATP diphosphatase HisIE [Bacteroidia bacterium]NNF30010.1 bifunctional phosphoribosyl-AMP cyclohydrolase/phosphoribosyl-ATP diphosphatase HisIE [Flavobacteriaceae bacterium]MBT8274747.1 bifunctional phosphoribosyl-AMP cyclohydrolase/phosphoribosyl-ATP diphosphatase HisIE [Bacteroidia bacterium]NNJ81499.1 bifunctional phosphoribosyl-AMP cyclohydrolase/phosphoribosyl-ATP diphosphatase HisIE [Flavobacteriaceae bacterium]NNK53715.1 bi
MKIDYNKYSDGLVPVVVQDVLSRNVLMLGFMNEEAVRQTLDTKRVTFFSRKKESLWTKGEESGNFLNLVSITQDCDNDSLLALVKPEGPVCHKGTDTCWGERNIPQFGFLSYLENVIQERKDNPEMENSYVASLFRKGVNKVAQKVGEEAVELVIEAKDDNDLAFLNEAADLLFHTMILLQTKGFHLRDVDKTLRSRHKFE